MKIAIIGCGVMGTAFAKQFSLHGHSLILCDRNPEKGKKLMQEIKSISFTSDPIEAASKAELILLAIKPKDLEAIAKQLEISSNKIILSILSGIAVHTLRKYFPLSQIVRGMPNLALLHGESVIGLVEEGISKETKQILEQLLKKLGLVFWTNEAKIDAVSALAGSGPAFLIAIMEAMVESGIAMGLSFEESQQLVLQTFNGTVSLVKNVHHHPGIIRWQISSPGGTTIAGMRVFEEEGVRSGIMNAFLATYQRNKEIK